VSEVVQQSRFLVLGGAGTIGQAVVRELFKRNPQKLHIVDLSENNLVELVRDLRSSVGYINGEFGTFAIDIGSEEYERFFSDDGEYDYVLNLSALKHVRSERNVYTLMRMIDVNIFNTEKTLKLAEAKGVKNYFAVSTDKAANPANMMGASKRVMEMILNEYSQSISITMARFANVAFSDGSLLQGFSRRIEKRQPIVAPSDVLRYFITAQEAGELCVMSAIFGENRDVFFPKNTEELVLTSFSDVAENYLHSKGLDPIKCSSEDEARSLLVAGPLTDNWPVLFEKSDTTGEKPFEEFYTASEIVDVNRFENIGIIKNESDGSYEKLRDFRQELRNERNAAHWSKKNLVRIFVNTVLGFTHSELDKFLDEKM